MISFVFFWTSLSLPVKKKKHTASIFADKFSFRRTTQGPCPAVSLMSWRIIHEVVLALVLLPSIIFNTYSYNFTQSSVVDRNSTDIIYHPHGNEAYVYLGCDCSFKRSGMMLILYFILQGSTRYVCSFIPNFEIPSSTLKLIEPFTVWQDMSVRSFHPIEFVYFQWSIGQ